MANIYLTRESQVLGPYTEEQYEEIKLKGELIKYFWYWDGNSPEWIPANPPPPLPNASATEAILASAGVAVQPTAASLPLRVICHDFHHLITGSFVDVNEQGCMLLTPAPRAGLPELHKGQHIWLSILNEVSSDAENIKGVISKTRRLTTGEWIYEITWKAIPELVRSIQTESSTQN